MRSETSRAGAVVFLVLGATILGYLAHLTWPSMVAGFASFGLARRAAGADRVDGKIEYLTVDGPPPGRSARGGAPYNPRIGYCYEVNGRTIHGISGAKGTPVPSPYRTHWEAKAALSKWSVGQTVPIAVDKTDPHWSVVLPDSSLYGTGPALAAIVVGLAPIVMGILVVLATGAAAIRSGQRKEPTRARRGGAWWMRGDTPAASRARRRNQT